MNVYDYLVLFGTMLGIAGYGVWRTRGRRDLRTYLKGDQGTRALMIGLSVMATQASAITFLSTPGQGYESGLGFVQNYFGAPFALIIIAMVFVPIYRRMNVYTAYEYLGQRFDAKTRLLGAGLFLLQRGLGAGLTVYAPAIVLSTVMGWRLDMTILGSGLVAIVYTVMGGSEAVNLTQRYQFSIILIGMVAAFVVLLHKLPAGLSFTDSLALAGGFHKLEAVDFSISVNKRYTFWSGLLGGMFLALAYFGTDQSQVQRYLSGASLRNSRLGLMFNALLKIPMQFFILLLGALLFVFYQFELPPVLFNSAAWTAQVAKEPQSPLRAIEREFADVHGQKKRVLRRWIEARHAGDSVAAAAARSEAESAQKRLDAIRTEAQKQLLAAVPGAKGSDTDYVFIRFIVDYLPHGMIGLLVAVFFAATLSAKSAELNALGSTTTIDLYRHLMRRPVPEEHFVAASKFFTVMWGLVALGFALSIHMAENLIQAVNILGSVFYGVVLGIFLTAFFLKTVRGTAVFWGAVVSQCLVIALYFTLHISYLWYNIIGCAACMAMSLLLQWAITMRGVNAVSKMGGADAVNDVAAL
ncbi:MAG TPA: sodium:solute symporter [Tepidisphaeraceae bacterium]